MASKSETVHQLSPETFHAEANTFLMAMQAQSRRVLSRLAQALVSPGGFQLFAIYQNSGLVGVVCFELSKSYICSAGIVTVEAAGILLEALRDKFGGHVTRLSGCDGPPMAADSIAIACKEAFGCVSHVSDSLETMILDRAPRPSMGVAGTLKSVSPGSKIMPVLALWFEQFEKDTDNECFSLQGHRQVVAHLSEAASRQDLFMWEVKDKPVAMVLLGRSQPKQVLCVYTPPHQRSRGYGQAVTASVCTDLWRTSGGKEPIILSAVHKFGAARIYERIGFKSTGWLHGISFEDKHCNTEVVHNAQHSESEQEHSYAKDEIPPSDVDTDDGTDVDTSYETDGTDEDIEADTSTQAIELGDDWLDLETDPAKLFASSSALLQCP